MRSTRLPDPAALGARLIILFAGFFLLAYGFAMLIEARMGVAPWVTLHMGLANHLPLTVGRATQLVGLVVLLLALALGVRPRIGTWLNMFLVGFFLDVAVVEGLVPLAAGPVLRLFYLFAGSAVAGLGVALYLCADFGAGPRDSLMLGLTRVSGRPVGGVRVALEITVVVMGYLLGGPVGIGTLVSAFLTGPAVQAWLILFSRAARTALGGRLLKPPVTLRLRLAPGGKPGG